MSSPGAGTDNQSSLMRIGTTAHKNGDLCSAESSYRAVLALCPHPGASLLLAGALLARATFESAAATALCTEALAHARASVANVSSRANSDATRLHTRFGLFLLQLTGVVLVEGGDAEGAPALRASLSDAMRSKLIGEAVAALEAATALDASSVIAWRHLATARAAAGATAGAAAAADGAVRAAGPRASWELYYKAGKAHKKAGDVNAALERYATAAEAARAAGDTSDASALPLFWLRVALAPGGEDGVRESTRERVAAVVGAADAAAAPVGDDSVCSSPTAPPNVYVQRLFDGYANNFDEHLVGALEYRTPEELRELACSARSGAEGAWLHAADVGCGTGLACASMHNLVEAWSGCDLSPKMIAAARARGGYGALAVGDAVGWLAGLARSAAASPSVTPVDFVVAADVLVYLGDLGAFFSAASAALEGASGGAARVDAEGRVRPAPIALVSTEALAPCVLNDEEEAALAPQGWLLTHTGRCAHARIHVRNAAGRAGLCVERVERVQLRKNAGEPVMGDLWVLRVAA